MENHLGQHAIVIGGSISETYPTKAQHYRRTDFRRDDSARVPMSAALGSASSKVAGPSQWTLPQELWTSPFCRYSGRTVEVVSVRSDVIRATISPVFPTTNILILKSDGSVHGNGCRG
jgi:hypothetical protein